MNEPGNPSLVKKIMDEIRKTGRIPFARFMEMALYDPECGYYNTREPIGRGGDYLTSPSVHPLFGRMIGKQIGALFQELEGESLTFVEIGAGEGNLTQTILEFLRNENPSLFKKLHFIIIERSRSMVSRQRKRFKEAGLAGFIRWVPGLDAMKRGGDLLGCVLSNELVDAFPVHRVAMTEEGLKELFLIEENGGIVEALGELSTASMNDYFKRTGIQRASGQRAEVNLNALSWMREVGKVLKKGYVLTMDYGHSASDLYAPHRKNGSLLCYYRHTVHDNPYVRIGEQDITAHVDFSSLVLEGRKAGLELSGFTDQQHFLMSMGMAEEMEGLDPENPEFLAMKRLIAGSAMGRTFKILIQHKGLSPPSLQCLSYKPFFKDSLFR